MTTNEAIQRASDACNEADALLITTGAGMGVDSGLPDFRGNEGFWNAYPSYRKLGVNFMEMANPTRFSDQPELGWGFYGHRRNLYRAIKPHAGFARLLDFGISLPHQYFCFTSNVDGHFQAANFDPERIIECHGSINHLQCIGDCEAKIWRAEKEAIKIDETTMRADTDSMPGCPDCGKLARPNILMFGDWGWNSQRCEQQGERYNKWLRTIIEAAAKLVVLEFGAGRAVPTVRLQSEKIASDIPEATLIRINPREPEIDPPCAGISLESGALEAIGELQIAKR
ncbi:MAG: NAD-dependent SIR2 family protein deacetylase [Pseudoalteromonas tetraodonis]|jgi:NAD-dependent SIR2 family protein deacetylase